MNTKRLTIYLTTALLMMGVIISAAPANQGPKQIDIYGGSHGKVPFPHAQHQTTIKDCNVCHAIFPQASDAIKSMKAAGQLKPKQVMNQHCIKCHRAEKSAGKPHGPLTCATCHVK